MTQNQQDTTSKPAIFDFMDHANTVMLNQPHDDSIQLQSPETIALDGLLSDLEFKERRYYSLAEQYFNIMQGDESSIQCTKEYAQVAAGIYANKSQDMRDLIDKWKPNKK